MALLEPKATELVIRVRLEPLDDQFVQAVCEMRGPDQDLLPYQPHLTVEVDGEVLDHITWVSLEAYGHNFRAKPPSQPKKLTALTVDLRPTYAAFAWAKLPERVRMGLKHSIERLSAFPFVKIRTDCPEYSPPPPPKPLTWWERLKLDLF